MLTIFLTICEVLEARGERGLGWKHQVMLGTMHSAVIKRDLPRVQELLAACEAGELDCSAVEGADHDGLTPLHYACLLRLPEIVRCLHGARADVTVTDNQLGLTPLHMSALQLDDLSLSLLVSNLFDLDLQDRKGRTPLFLACLEGRAVSGQSDPLLLRGCLSVLLALGADPDGALEQAHAQAQAQAQVGPLLPCHVLASAWQAEPLLALLQAGASVNTTGGTERELVSLGPLGAAGTPLHVALAARSLKPAVGLGALLLASDSSGSGSGGGGGGEGLGLGLGLGSGAVFSGVEVESPLASGCVATLRALLQYGARPNQKDAAGRTPLQVLVENEAAWRHSGRLPTQRSEAVSLLISFGARLDDSNLCLALRAQCPEVNLDALAERWSQSPAVNTDVLGLRLNGLDKTAGAASGPGGSSRSGSPDGKPVGSSSGGGGGSPSGGVTPLCVLCGTGFTLFRRQHHCRLCNALCCDDCSKRRAVIEGSQHRTCDSCFNVVLYRLDCVRATGGSGGGGGSSSAKTATATATAAAMVSTKTGNAVTAGVARTSSSPPPAPVVADQHLSNKSALFAGAAAAPATGQGRQQQQGQQGGGLSAAMGAMSEAGERLRERGQKLERLGDKSADMANAASDFARLAKQLNEQQKNRWF